MTVPRIEFDLCGPSLPVARYLRARATHDAALGRRSFHPETVSRAVCKRGSIVAIDQDEMWTIADASTTVPLRQSHRILDQLGSLAVVETRGEWTTHNLVDLLLVVRQPSGWLIVGRVLARSAAEATPPPASTDDHDQIRDLIGSCAGLSPRPSQLTHVADCRYTFAGELGLQRSVAEPSWQPDYLGGHTGRHQRPTVAVEARGNIAAARLLRTLHPHRIVNHVLLVKDRDGWKIAHVTCAFTPKDLIARVRGTARAAR